MQLVNSSQRGVALVVGIVLFAAPGVQAQAPDTQGQAPDAQVQATDVTGRIFFHLNGTSQTGIGEFRESLPFTIYSEQASFDSVHDVGGGGGIDVGGHIGVWRSPLCQ